MLRACVVVALCACVRHHTRRPSSGHNLLCPLVAGRGPTGVAAPFDNRSINRSTMGRMRTSLLIPLAPFSELKASGEQPRTRTRSTWLASSSLLSLADCTECIADRHRNKRSRARCAFGPPRQPSPGRSRGGADGRSRCLARSSSALRTVAARPSERPRRPPTQARPTTEADDERRPIAYGAFAACTHDSHGGMDLLIPTPTPHTQDGPCGGGSGGRRQQWQQRHRHRAWEGESA